MKGQINDPTSDIKTTEVLEQGFRKSSKADLHTQQVNSNWRHARRVSYAALKSYN